MPLNLLKHKSYHVHNARNVERVRRDEAAAAKRAEAERTHLKREKLAALRGPARGGIESGSRASDRSASGNWTGLSDVGAFELDELKRLHEDDSNGHYSSRKEPDQNATASSTNFDHNSSRRSYSDKTSNRDVQFEYGENGSVVSLLLGQHSQGVARADSSHDNVSSSMIPNFQGPGYQESKLHRNLQGDSRYARSKAELDPLAGMLRGVAATEAYEREHNKSHQSAANPGKKSSSRTRRHRHEHNKDKERDRDGHRVHKSRHSRHYKSSSNSQRHENRHRSERNISSRDRKI